MSLHDVALSRAKAHQVAKAAQREAEMVIAARVDFAPLERLCADREAFLATCTPERAAELTEMWS